MKDLRQQISALSDKQRLLLWRRLRRTSSSHWDDTSVRRRLLAYVTTVDHQSRATGDELRRYLAEHLPDFMVPESVMIVESLPRLPNGKVNVHALPDPAKRGTEDGDDFVAPRTETEKILAGIWSELLHTDLLSVHDNFFEVGGDSIVSIQVVSRAREAGLEVQPSQLADHPTIAGLAAVIHKKSSVPFALGPETGDAPLTPIQHWFLSREVAAPHHWNQARLLAVDARLTPEMLHAAMQRCFAHHDGLRARFRHEQDGWRQIIPDDASPPPLEIVSIPDAAGQDRLHREIMTRQHGFDLQATPLIRCALFQRGDEQPDLFQIVVHHLVIDQVSWSILLEDLDRACQAELRREEPMLPTKTSALIHWTRRLNDYAASDECRKSVDFWTRETPADCHQLPTDYTCPRRPDEASADSVSVVIDQATTDLLLTEAVEVYRAGARELLLTALALTMTDWTGRRAVTIDLEGHGREPLFADVDLSRTVGWFTSFFPVTIDLTSADPRELASAVAAVKEQLRAVPRNGLDYGVLRWLSRDRDLVDALTALPAAQVLFNYAGAERAHRDFPSFQMVNGDQHSLRDASNTRSHPLEINAVIRQGCLSTKWTYSRKLHRRGTIQRLATNFRDTVTRLVEYAHAPGVTTLTASDFPESGLSQDELDAFLNDLD